MDYVGTAMLSYLSTVKSGTALRLLQADSPCRVATGYKRKCTKPKQIWYQVILTQDKHTVMVK